MNRWQEQLTNHQIHETLREAKELLEAKHKDVTAETEREKLRFLKILEKIEAAISQIDPDTFPFSFLDGINNGIRHQNVWNELESYASNGNGAHLTNANNHMASHLPTLAQLEGLVLPPDVKKLTKSVERSVDSFIESLAERKEELAGDLGKLAKAKTSFESDLEALTQQIRDKREENDQIVSDFSRQFQESETERDSAYEEWRKAHEEDARTQVRELIETQSTALASKQKSFSTESQRLLDEAKQKHKEILELHEIVASDSVSAGYMKNAKDEKVQANFWRWASILFIVATAGWTIFAYLTVADSTDSSNLSYWGQALKALSVAAVLLFGAVYASKQSNLHRISEQRTRWLALEVKAIDPFIASLSPEEQTELKKRLSEKLFGQRGELEGSDENTVNEHVLETVLKSATDIVKASRS